MCDEKLAVCTASIMAKDLRALTSPKQKHKALGDKMVRRHNRFLSGSLATGQDMPCSRWRLSKGGGTLFFSDCNETDTIIKESIFMAKSNVKLRPVHKDYIQFYLCTGFWKG